MEKGRAFVFTVFTLASAAVVVSACSDDDESTFKESPPDASLDSPGTFNVDSGGGEGGTLGDAEPGAKCEPVIPDDYQPAWTPPVKVTPGPCAAGDIDAYFEACVANIGSPDAGADCDAWKASNAACGTCAEPANNSGPIQWHQQRFYYTLNVAGCIAIQQDKLGDQDCGAAYNAAVQCSREACGGCFKTGTSTFDNFRDCQTQAANVGFCKSLETQQASLCTDVKTETETALCFKDAAEQADVFYKRVIGIFCGP